jgi:phosphoribosylaminoimidazolecarboxamide formyltransferase/IMP cyclohydrolase
MSELKGIRTALISVFYKDGLESIALKLHELGVTIYSTGGTQTFLEKLGIEVIAVEDLTSYPSILGGRVKTLHPKVFGGILSRRNESNDIAQLEEYDIPELDLVIVDLYPFQETIQAGASEEEIIEKIDIGGVSLIRAAAKNFNDVLVVSDRSQYAELNKLLTNQQGETRLTDRKQFAAAAFANISTYDNAISSWFSESTKPLRYGENPHQKGFFNGDLSKVFDQLHGKELSYNNLLDIDAALSLIEDFSDSGCAIIKHNNACGAAIDSKQITAWKKALAGDPLSAFGGIFVFNTPLEIDTAKEVDSIFFEVILAPSYSTEVLEILKSKKNRIILQTKKFDWPQTQLRSSLNGTLIQDRDIRVESAFDFKTVTEKQPNPSDFSDLQFAGILAKHTKSNAIVLVKNLQLLASGTGQTSRVDAVKQSIEKCHRMGFETTGAVLASDAFFPFHDNIELAAEAGISAIVQPGGSVRDQECIDTANRLGIAMVITGIRHFKH